MKEDSARLLTGVIEADETWIGGKQKGVGMGNWRAGKTMILGAVERGGQVRLRVDKRPTKRPYTLLRTAVDDTAMLYSARARWYEGFRAENAHENVVHHNEERMGARRSPTNSIEACGACSRSVVVLHQLSARSSG